MSFDPRLILIVARDCHGKDASNSNRSAVVTAIGEGFRIEGSLILKI